MYVINVLVVAIILLNVENGGTFVYKISESSTYFELLLVAATDLYVKGLLAWCRHLSVLGWKGLQDVCDKAWEL